MAARTVLAIAGVLVPAGLLAQSANQADHMARSALDRFQASEIIYLWPAGTTIQGCLTGGRDEERQIVVEAGQEWMKYAKIKFDFGAPPRFRDCTPDGPQPPLRVVFPVSHTSWALTGTRAILETSQRPTMQIGVSPPTARVSVVRTDLMQKSLHEFGHVLGMTHEHQHPDSDCYRSFDWGRVCSASNFANLKGSAVTGMIIRAYLPRIATNGPDPARAPYDTKSIMHYQYGPAHFKVPTSVCGGGRATIGLSDGDKARAARYYPADAKAQARLIQGQAAVLARVFSATSSVTPYLADRMAREAEFIVRRTHPQLAFAVSIKPGARKDADNGAAALERTIAGDAAQHLPACEAAAAKTVPRGAPAPPKAP